MSRVTSEARERALAEDSVEEPVAEDAPAQADEPAEEPAVEPQDDDAAEEDAADRGSRSRSRNVLVPVLAVLLVLLLAAAGWLYLTRPKPSSVHTADYVAVLQAARSEIVDLTSFDYLTLDEDIAKIKRITTGDLRRDTVDQLNKTRQSVTDAQAVVSTEVIAAAVTAADDEHGTVVLFIQSTQKNNTVSQAQVLQFHIEAKLTKVDGRWLLSGISGRG
jgi:Mce-associated membrane protein